ncbi:ferritin-like domain-containing protein [Nocardiopsis ganjiahuensis]|uniref:ferritin-like domain-containing protein n=1 Tax=Nocardiopsis ganjiahuensis TaxID=239984 RepID=UPI000344A342|nr:ferritin-like domain-containing protein [Nocardiopsis ganjiahuensis]
MSDSPAPAESPQSPEEGAGPTGGGDPTAAALAEALSAEHAAVYGFEFVGGAAGDETRRERASAAAYEHKAMRDTLHAAAVERDIDPPPALASYSLPEGRSGTDMDEFAAGLEETTMSAYLWLSSSPDTDLRITAARVLQEATVRSLVWGAGLDPLPGFGES